MITIWCLFTRWVWTLTTGTWSASRSSSTTSPSSPPAIPSPAYFARRYFHFHFSPSLFTFHFYFSLFIFTLTIHFLFSLFTFTFHFHFPLSLSTSHLVTSRPVGKLDRLASQCFQFSTDQLQSLALVVQQNMAGGPLRELGLPMGGPNPMSGMLNIKGQELFMQVQMGMKIWPVSICLTY